MATAEKLLHEAQYAYQSISFGESRDNRRNTSRATSLAKKIIRKYPVSMEAGEARAILRRLGEEGYSFKSNSRHTHSLPDAPKEAQHRHRPPQTKVMRSQRSRDQRPIDRQQTNSLDLGRFVSWLFGLPRYLQIVFIFVGFILFSILGPFLLIPLALIIIFATPLRQFTPVEMRREVDAFVRSVNEWLADHDKE